MADLSPEAKRMLAELRGVDDPTPAERSSGDAAVRRMLETHGMELPPATPNTSTALAARSGAVINKLAWLFGAALLAAMGFWGVDAWRSSHTTARATSAEPTSPSPTHSSASTVADTTRREVNAEPVVQPQRAAPAHTSQAATGQRRQNKSEEDSLAAELRFLSSVDAELRAGAHDRALRMLQQHKSATAILQEERAAMRVLALCGHALDAHAVRERDHFLKAHPSSVLSARVRSTCTGVPSR